MNRRESRGTLPAKSGSVVHWLLCASFLAPYLWFTLPHLSLPGPFFDETYTALPSFLFLDALGIGLDHVREIGLDWHAYHGPTEALLLTPLLALFGVRIEVLRAFAVLGGAATLLLTYRFCRDCFHDTLTAWACCLLLSTYFVFFVSATRFGMLTGSVLLVFQSGALLFFLRWRRGAGLPSLCLGCLCCGAALSSRSWFLFSLAALAAVGTVYFAKPVLLSVRRAPRRAILIGILGLLSFLAGWSPFFLRPARVAELRSAAVQRLPRTPDGVDNSDYLGNLKRRLRQVCRLPKKDHLVEKCFQTPPDRRRSPPWSRILLLLAHGWLLGSCRLAGGRVPVRLRLFPLTFTACFLAASPFAATVLQDDHLLPVVPFLAMTLALSLTDAVDRLFKVLPLARRNVIAGAVVLLIGGRAPPAFPARLRSPHGLAPLCSPAAYALNDWLLAEGATHPCLIDRGLQYNLEFLSAGRIFPVRAFAPEFVADPEGFPRLVRDAAIRYVLYDEGDADTPARRGLREAAAAAGKELRLLRGFPDPDGSPAISVYEAAPLRARPEPPPDFVDYRG